MDVEVDHAWHQQVMRKVDGGRGAESLVRPGLWHYGDDAPGTDGHRMVVEDDACGFYRNDPACANDEVDSFTQVRSPVGADVSCVGASGDGFKHASTSRTIYGVERVQLATGDARLEADTPWAGSAGLRLADACGFVQQSSHSSSTAMARVHPNA